MRSQRRPYVNAGSLSAWSALGQLRADGPGTCERDRRARASGSPAAPGRAGVHRQARDRRPRPPDDSRMSFSKDLEPGLHDPLPRFARDHLSRRGSYVDTGLEHESFDGLISLAPRLPYTPRSDDPRLGGDGLRLDSRLSQSLPCVRRVSLPTRPAILSGNDRTQFRGVAAPLGPLLAPVGATRTIFGRGDRHPRPALRSNGSMIRRGLPLDGVRRSARSPQLHGW